MIRDLPPGALAIFTGLLSIALAVAFGWFRRHRRDLERQLRGAEFASRAAGVGYWELCADGGEMRWSRPVFDLLEMPHTAVPSWDRLLSFCGPDSQTMLADALRQAQLAGHPFDLEADITTARGTGRTVRVVGQPSAATGSPATVTGALVDITALRSARLAGAEAAARVHALVSSSDAWVARLDLDGVIRELRAPSMGSSGSLGAPDIAHYVGANALDVLPAAVSLSLREALAVIHRGAPHVTFEHRFPSRAGVRAFTCRLAALPHHAQQSRSVCAVVRERTVHLRHAAELADCEDRLRALRARYDKVVARQRTEPEWGLRDGDELATLLPAGLVIWALRDGRVLEANDTVAALLGTSRTTFREQTWWSLVSQPARARERLEVAALLNGASLQLAPVHTTMRMGDSPPVAVIVHRRLVDRPDGPAMLALVLEERVGQMLVAEGAAVDTRSPPPASCDEETEPAPALLAEAFVRALPGLCSVLPSAMSLLTIVAADLPDAWIDPRKLDRALRELLSNAAEASSGRGVIILRARRLAAPITSAQQAGSGIPHPAVTAWTVVDVSDAGEGMDSVTARRALDPFFTTRTTRPRPGLGLAIVSGIIEHYGGSVKICSTKGQGTTVSLWIPSAAASGGLSEMAVGNAGSSSAGESASTTFVLTADVDRRTSWEAALRQAGYRVIAGADTRIIHTWMEDLRGGRCAIVGDVTASVDDWWSLLQGCAQRWPTARPCAAILSAGTLAPPPERPADEFESGSPAFSAAVLLRELAFAFGEERADA